MKRTEQESSDLKRAFKYHFLINGYDAPLSSFLERERYNFPIEWREACQEWERDIPPSPIVDNAT